MAEAVTCAPNKLVFSLRLGEPSSTALRLENPSDERVAFKVRTTAPKVYCVRPASGVLEPGAQAECVVKRSAPSALPAKGGKCKDKFRVECLTVGPGVSEELTELFQQCKADVVGTNLNVVLIPASHTTPVAPSPAAGPQAPPPPQLPAASGQQLRLSPAAGRPLPAAGAAVRASPTAAAAAAGPEGASPAAGSPAALPAASEATLALPQGPASVAKPRTGGPAAAAVSPLAPSPAAAAPAGHQRSASPAAHQPSLLASPPAVPAAGAVASGRGTDAAAAKPAGKAGEPAATGAADSAAPAPAAAASPGPGSPSVDGQQYVGRKVLKTFDGRPFAGKVLSFDPDVQWWLIKYEDSDSEEIAFEELQRIMRAAEEEKVGCGAAPPRPASGPAAAANAAPAPGKGQTSQSPAGSPAAAGGWRTLKPASPRGAAPAAAAAAQPQRPAEATLAAAAAAEAASSNATTGSPAATPTLVLSPSSDIEADAESMHECPSSLAWGSRRAQSTLRKPRGGGRMAGLLRAVSEEAEDPPASDSSPPESAPVPRRRSAGRPTHGHARRHKSKRAATHDDNCDSDPDFVPDSELLAAAVAEAEGSAAFLSALEGAAAGEEKLARGGAGTAAKKPGRQQQQQQQQQQQRQQQQTPTAGAAANEVIDLVDSDEEGTNAALVSRRSSAAQHSAQQQRQQHPGVKQERQAAVEDSAARRAQQQEEGGRELIVSRKASAAKRARLRLGDDSSAGIGGGTDSALARLSSGQGSTPVPALEALPRTKARAAREPARRLQLSVCSTAGAELLRLTVKPHTPMARVLGAVEQHCGAQLRAGAAAPAGAALAFSVAAAGAGRSGAMEFSAGDALLAGGQTVRGLGLRGGAVLRVSV